MRESDTGAGLAQAVERVGVQPQRDQSLEALQLRPAGTAIRPDHRLAMPEFGVLEERRQ
jgi:hypothetical protein